MISSTYYYLIIQTSTDEAMDEGSMQLRNCERAKQTKLFTDGIYLSIGLDRGLAKQGEHSRVTCTLYGASTHMVDGTTVPVAAPHTHTETQCYCETATRRTTRTPHRSQTTVIWARSPEPHSRAVLYNHDSSTSVHTALYLYCIQ